VEECNSTIGTARRYYLAKRHVAEDLCDNLAEVWRSKQENEPGTPLPATFPYLEVLAERGYETVEDLTGASVKELTDRCFNSADAEIILAALDELL
jgi:hypothetical protein